MVNSFLSQIFPFIRKKVRLRHILHLGSMMERQAETCYRRFAEHSQNDATRNLYLQLANEEVKHFELISEQLSSWKPLPVAESDLEAMDAKGEMRNMFSSPPNPDAKEEEIVNYAINEEKKMIVFYEKFEKEFSDWFKATKLKAMVADEKIHIHKLSKLLLK